MEQQTIYSKPVLEFYTVANEYCLYMEEIDKYPQESIFNYLQRILPLLYLKGSLLPEIGSVNEEANERFVTEEQRETIAEHIKLKMGNNDKFIDLVVSLSENEIQNINLSDELSLIYNDLKDFLILFQKNTLDAKGNAIKSCKKYFENNWGERLIITHKYIHNHIYVIKSKHEEDSLPFNDFLQ
ncbi:MAG: DUF5063 domain-containing protein [Bacteroidota bacterium]|nr:DUF5063 domain-containing protein [Bacteroidota bacterium]